MSKDKDTSIASMLGLSDTTIIVVKVAIFVVPFLIIGLMSYITKKSYTNSMADYTIYRRYFSLAILILFLLLSIGIGLKEYYDYRETGKDEYLTYAKISGVSTIMFLIFILLNLIVLWRLKRIKTENRAKIEAYHQTMSGVRTAFSILKQ